MTVHVPRNAATGSFATAAMLSLGALTTGAFAQGLVEFQNNSTVLISYGAAGNTAALPANEPGKFYFALLTSGTETGPFSFAGVYGTNSAGAGRIFICDATVPGWPLGATMYYEVAGWSSNLGATWNSQWLVNNAPAGAAGNVWGAAGYFGLSGIALGVAGGFSTLPVPAWILFGGSGLTGFNLAPVGVPEPSNVELWVLGAIVLVILRWREIIAPNPASAVDAPITSRFHIVRPRRRATDQRCSTMQ